MNYAIRQLSQCYRKLIKISEIKFGEKYCRATFKSLFHEFSASLPQV